MKRNTLGLFIAIVSIFAFCGSVSLAETLNPNYGTTTYFSEKNAKPVLSEPILDVGAGANSNKNSGNKNNKDGNSTTQPPPGSIFSQIINGFDSLLSGSTNANQNKGSLFDLQGNSNQDSSGDSSGDSSNSGEFMGARGESAEYLASGDDAYHQSLSSKFNFSDNGSGTAPKKSKLIFTNVVIPMDLTTQYIVIGLTFMVAVGATVGYYFWKKEEAKDKKKYSQENYD